MKKHWRWILLLLPVVFLGGFLRWKTSQPEYVLNQFIRRQGRLLYRSGAVFHLEALENWKKKHNFPTDAVVGYDKGKPLLIWFSWQRDNVYKVEICVDSTGNLIQVWETENEVTLTSPSSKLSKSEINILKRQLKQYPVCVSPSPILENILFVSYLDGKEWKARVYDRHYLPEPVRATLKILKGRAGDFLNKEKPDRTQ